MKVEVEVKVEEDSFALLQERGRSGSFRGQYSVGQPVTVICDGSTQQAVISRAGKSSWVAKKK